MVFLDPPGGVFGHQGVDLVAAQHNILGGDVVVGQGLVAVHDEVGQHDRLVVRELYRGRIAAQVFQENLQGAFGLVHLGGQTLQCVEKGTSILGYDHVFHMVPQELKDFLFVLAEQGHRLGKSALFEAPLDAEAPLQFYHQRLGFLPGDAEILGQNLVILVRELDRVVHHADHFFARGRTPFVKGDHAIDPAVHRLPGRCLAGRALGPRVLDHMDVVDDMVLDLIEAHLQVSEKLLGQLGLLVSLPGGMEQIRRQVETLSQQEGVDLGEIVGIDAFDHLGHFLRRRTGQFQGQLGDTEFFR